MGDRGWPAAVLIAVASACSPDLGACDEAAARAVVYDPEGYPAYEGQALLISSCGAGGFCHAEGIEPLARHGAPAGLDLDLRLASVTPEVEAEALERLRRSQRNAYFLRELVWSQVDGGHMPPPGIGAVVAQAAPRYERRSASEPMGPALPGVETAEGRAVLRNWLACGANVIERTMPRNDGVDPTIGDVHPSGEAPAIEPRWSVIHERVLVRSCAFAMCHDGQTAAGDLDLTNAAASYAALVGRPASGRLCVGVGAARVVAGDADGSLFVHKLEGHTADNGDVCGTRMPQAGMAIARSRLDAIRAWIDAGARPD